jgi:hypothetical protein
MFTCFEAGLCWQFATAEGITQQLSGPRAKLPPPVLQENGHIDMEYFRVLADKEGAYVTNSPASFPEDHAGKCIGMMSVLTPPLSAELLSFSVNPPPPLWCVTPFTCVTVIASPSVAVCLFFFCPKTGAVTPQAQSL